MHQCLIVDDSTTQRKLIARIAQQCNLEIIEAPNGLEALKICEDNVPDMIILDLNMPEMDGYTLTAEIRNHPKLKELHIVLHTSLSGVFNQAMVNKVGADDFIAKFFPDKLAMAVQSRLEAIAG